MKQEFQEACDDPDNPVVDVNANGDEVLSMLIQRDGGPPDMIDGTPENVLLFIHELHEFVYGEDAAVLCNDPHIAVQPTNRESTYRLIVNDRSVENMPDQADGVLRGVKQAIEDGDLTKIIDVYEEIIDKQVRRDVVNELLVLLPKFPEERIRVTEQGWLIDRYYLVDWTASVYTKEDNDSENYRRSGSQVDAYDKSFEFVELDPGKEPERAKVMIDGEERIIGEREMLFLYKVEWLLNRYDYHEDKPFWLWQERRRERFLGDDE
jgi:hypothetical protein